MARVVAAPLLGGAAAALSLVVSPSRLYAGEAPVDITGGADAAGVNYQWNVLNLRTSPIVYIEFPHYHASLFFAPQGWSTESTFLRNVGVADRPGVCIARAASAASGIVRGRPQEFKIQVEAAGTRRGLGDVLVRFADDTEFVVHHVELPVPEAVGSKYLPLIGLSTIAVVVLGVKALRRRTAGS